jgi:hypothetical protein
MFKPGRKPDSSPLPRRAFLSGAALAAAGATFRPGAASAADIPLSASYSSRGSGVNGEIAIEEDGSNGIDSLSGRTGWSNEPPMRVRISRAEADNSGAEHMLLLPYEYGIALEYAGVVEAWVTDFSVHGRGTGARLWIGNNDDTGGILISATRRSGVRFAEITSQLFSGETGGSLRFTVRAPSDAFEFRSGPNEHDTTKARITADGDLLTRDGSDGQVAVGAVGPGNSPGVTFGKQASVKLWAEGDSALRTDSLLVAGGGLGFSSTTPATGLGNLKSTVEVFDGTGASIGVMPIYEAAAQT